ncbi:MAG: hypothetical protein Q7J29_11795 [Stagnimonas sp.]|nr:hypothetical protein [Stagnimonas sp.]
MTIVFRGKPKLQPSHFQKAIWSIDLLKRMFLALRSALPFGLSARQQRLIQLPVLPR